MRCGDRILLRNLRCTGYFYKERHSRVFGDYIEHHYRFAGTDGRTYTYRGSYIPNMQTGCYLDCRCTAKSICDGGDMILIGRITPVPTLANQPDLL